MTKKMYLLDLCTYDENNVPEVKDHLVVKAVRTPTIAEVKARISDIIKGKGCESIHQIKEISPEDAFEEYGCREEDCLTLEFYDFRSAYIPLVVHYSFDPTVPVWLFSTIEEAKAELKRQFDEEVRIDTEENGRQKGRDYITFFAGEGDRATICIKSDDCDAVTEWSIGEVQNG